MGDRRKEGPGASARWQPPCLACGKAAARRCGGCHLAPYCSSECQKGDWRAHRKTCKALAAGPDQARDDRDQAALLEAVRAVLTAPGYVGCRVAATPCEVLHVELERAAAAWARLQDCETAHCYLGPNSAEARLEVQLTGLWSRRTLECEESAAPVDLYLHGTQLWLVRHASHVLHAVEGAGAHIAALMRDGAEARLAKLDKQ